MPLQFAYGPPVASIPPEGACPGRLLRLFYASKATRPFDKAGLEQLMENSRRNNERNAITGLLCHKNDFFAQILEGEEHAVLETYLRVTRDPRHTEPTLLSISLVPSRIFAGWRMGHLTGAPLLDDTWEAVLRLRSCGETGLQAKFRRWLTLLEEQSRPASPAHTPKRGVSV